MRNFKRLVLAALIAGESVGVAQGRSEQQDSLARHLRGGGDWATDGRRQRAAQTWDLDVKRVGDSLAGTIELSGSALATSGFV